MVKSCSSFILAPMRDTSAITSRNRELKMDSTFIKVYKFRPVSDMPGNSSLLESRKDNLTQIQRSACQRGMWRRPVRQSTVTALRFQIVEKHPFLPISISARWALMIRKYKRWVQMTKRNRAQQIRWAHSKVWRYPWRRAGWKRTVSGRPTMQILHHQLLKSIQGNRSGLENPMGHLIWKGTQQPSIPSQQLRWWI